MKDRSLAKKRPLSCAKGVSSPNGFKQSLKRQIRSFFLYDMDPDAFRVNQLFQQTGLVWELDDSTRQQIQEIGKRNYVVARRLVEKAISLGLL